MIKSIISGRGTGKTKQIIEYAKDSGATIVCADVDSMIDKIHRYGYVGIPVIKYEEFFSMAHDPHVNYVVDEVEGLLEKMNVSAFTCNA